MYGYEGPQAMTARPSEKGRFSEDKIVGRGDVTMKSVGRTEVELGLAALLHKFRF
jgi:hypothetical protein